MGISGKVTTRQAISGGLDKSRRGGDITTQDYNDLINQPSVEGVQLRGNKLLTDFGIPYVFYGTREYWDSQPSLISIEKAIYIYWDYEQDSEGNNVPGIKVGDGKGYLIDAPFTSDPYYTHIRDQLIHVSPEDRQRWDNKIRCFIDPEDTEKIVFTTD